MFPHLKMLKLDKEILGVDHNDLKVVIDMMNLSENANYKKDSMEHYLTLIGKNPRFYTLFEALGIKHRHTRPISHPTERIALFDDIKTLWQVKTITKFLSQTHVFDEPARFCTYAVILNRYEAIRTTCMNLDFCVWNKQFIKLRNLAATAYNNFAHFDTHYDRIEWALRLLEPLPYWQIAMLGFEGVPINERLDAEDATYAATVDFWRGLIDPEYFSAADASLFQVERKENERIKYNYVSMAIPPRTNYAKFLKRFSTEVVTVGSKTLHLDYIEECSDVPNIEDEYLKGFQKLVEEEKESLLTIYKENFFVTDRRITRLSSEVLPRVTYNLPYTMLFLCGLLAQVELKEPRGVTVEPTRLANELLTPLRATSILAVSSVSRTISIFDSPNDILGVIKNMAMYSCYTLSKDSFSVAEETYLSKVSDLLTKVFKWLAMEKNPRLELSIPVVRDTSLTHEVLAACDIRFDRPEYDIAVKPISINGIDASMFDTDSAAFNVPRTNIVNGLFAAASLFFTITTPFKPFKPLEFPKSTKWRGSGIYERNEFPQVINDARSAMKHSGTITAEKGKFRWRVATPLPLSTELLYSGDMHLTLMTLNTLRDLVSLYKRISDYEERKYMRRQFIRVLADIGATLKRSFGLTQHNSYDDRNVKYHDMLQCVDYAIWYFNFVFGTPLKPIIRPINQDVKIKDFEYWVDVWS